MTLQIKRRLEALEAATETDKLRLLFVSFMEADAPRRLSTEWCGERFTQDADETEESFTARVRAAVNINRPAANCAAVLFLNSVDRAL